MSCFSSKMLSLISSHRSHVGEINSSWRDSLKSSKTSMANMHVEKVQSGVQSTELKSGIDSSQSGIRISGIETSSQSGIWVSGSSQSGILVSGIETSFQFGIQTPQSWI